MRPLFLVWTRYQRRAEVLAPLLGAEVKFFPHLFRSKALRPIDYFIKLILSVLCILKVHPTYLILQAPPLFPALAAVLTRVPFVFDVHNSLLQTFWGKLPFSDHLVRRARALIVHNQEIRKLAERRYPWARLVTIPDPLEEIGRSGVKRQARKVTFVCSFDNDEPVDAIIRVIEALPEHEFVITADPGKLPAAQRVRLISCPNLQLTGFLETEEYHELLLSSAAAVVLTTMPALQPSGASEALSSNTPLLVSRTSLTEALYGNWAVLVDNDAESVIRAIRSLPLVPLDLSAERESWNAAVCARIREFKSEIEGSVDLAAVHRLP